MEALIQNLKAVAINFPTRKHRNRTKENWDPSKKQKIFFDKQAVRIDGKSGDVLVDFKISPYLKEKLVKREISIGGLFFPEDTDEEIEGLLDLSAVAKLKGKPIAEATAIELLEAGLLEL